MEAVSIVINRDGKALGVAETAWREALEKAMPDPAVGIRHAAICGDEGRRFHVAAIPSQVGCHFHRAGREDYAVVAGSGTLHWGRPVKTEKGYTVEWSKPVDVTTGDSFVIPEGCAHQLRKRGGADDLVILPRHAP
jgi:mannose-6-phosphate isomerase-like protein (cupin superfamily)